MGVYIRGMAMPETCKRCDFETDELLCDLTGNHTDNARKSGRLDSCPLVEVKELHGDLIDRDELEKAVLKWLPPDPCGVEEREHPFETDICVSMMQEIEEQSVVIEAEGAES